MSNYLTVEVEIDLREYKSDIQKFLNNKTTNIPEVDDALEAATKDELISEIVSREIYTDAEKITEFFKADLFKIPLSDLQQFLKKY